MYTNKINNSPLQQNKNSINNQSMPRNMDFHKIFHEQVTKNKELKFSKHALDRLRERNVQLSPQEISKINDAVESAGKKGVKEALILMDNKAFIASVSNRTIITAAMEEQLKNNLFTNIDGAIIV